MSKEFHLSDEEMLLSADGELSTHRATHVRTHLAECWVCRARMAEIEATIADFARAHRQTFDPELPPIAGARAHMRSQLAELASTPPVRSWQWLFQFVSPFRAAAYLGIAVVVAVVAVELLLEHSKLSGTEPGVLAVERGAEPDPRLTPGATRKVTLNDVCSMAHEEVVGQVSTPLRQEVFREYGIMNVGGGDYEVDYLIAPGLGGVEDIRNLWPEPSTSPTWNAYVKDALEERLHEMVCAGTLDISTAQRDISTDWIAAYRKYFNTDRPLPMHSRLEAPTRTRVM